MDDKGVAGAFSYTDYANEIRRNFFDIVLKITINQIRDTNHICKVIMLQNIP